MFGVFQKMGKDIGTSIQYVLKFSRPLLSCLALMGHNKIFLEQTRLIHRNVKVIIKHLHKYSTKI